MKSLETVYNDIFKGKTVKFKSFTGEETVILVESVIFVRDYSDIHLEVVGVLPLNSFIDTVIIVSLNDEYEVL